MSRVHVFALTTAVLVLTASADALAQAAAPAPVPLVADDSEIGAFERDAVPPEINTVPPRRLRDVAPVWPSPVTERWRFRVHLILDAAGKVGESRIVQTLVGDPAARPVGPQGDVAPHIRSTPSARAGLAVLAATRQWQFERPVRAPMLIVTDVGVAEDVALSPSAASSRSTRPPLQVGGDIQPPTKVQDVRPIYPPEAVAARITGTVTIEARIGPTGAVEEARVVSGVPMLDAPALDAVRQWRYTPTLVNGEPVAVVMTVTVTFSLSH